MTSIVASVGTDHHHFDRLVGWLDDYAVGHPEVDVFVQHGQSAPPAVATGAPLLPLEELRARFAAATAVVTHGGPATITDVIDAGRKPLVVPRRPDLGEHVDDHQVLFTRRLAIDDRIVLVTDRDDLVRHLERAVESPDDYRVAPGREELATSVRRFARLVADLEP